MNSTATSVDAFSINTVRFLAVDAVDRLMKQGIRERDILAWEKVSAKTHLTPDTISEDREKLGSLCLKRTAMPSNVQFRTSGHRLSRTWRS